MKAKFTRQNVRSVRQRYALLLFILSLALALPVLAQVPSGIPVRLASGEEKILPKTGTDPSGYPRYSLTVDQQIYTVFFDASNIRWEFQSCTNSTCVALSYGSNVPPNNDPPYGAANWSNANNYVGSETAFRATTVTRNIVTDYWPVSYLCAGSASYRLEYAVGTAFPTSQPFVTVQLSDAAGSFSNPTELGNGGGPGSNAAPYFFIGLGWFGNMPLGNGYKIRLQSYWNSVYYYSNEIAVSLGSPPTAPAIDGESSDLCPSVAYTYTASAIPEATGYNWVVNDNSGFGNPSPATGVTMTGQGTRSVQITLSANSNANEIRVYAMHPCGNSPATSLWISKAQTLPAITSIVGESNPLAGNSYNYSYNFENFYGSVPVNTWTYSGTGVTLTPSGTNSVHATFSASATSGELSVTAGNGCQTVGPSVKALSILTAKVTASNGLWSEASTWEGNAVPLATDIVEIAHDVQVSNADCRSLTVRSSGKLTVSGDFTVGEMLWDGTSNVPCGYYMVKLDGILQIDGGTMHIGGSLNKTQSGTFKMTSGLVQVRRGGCGGSDIAFGPLVGLLVNEGDVTGGTIEILGNSGSYGPIIFGNFGTGSTIRIGKPSATSVFTGFVSSFTYRTYLPITFDRVGNVEIYNITSPSAAVRPVLLAQAGDYYALARINGSLLLQSANTVLVGDEYNFSTPTTLGLAVKGNFVNNAATLEMAAGRTLFFGGDGFYNSSAQLPYCINYTNASQSIGGTGSITGNSCNCNAQGLTLANPMIVPRLTLYGNMTLGDNDLTIDQLKIPANPTGYFITNGSGKLRLRYSGSNNVTSNTFPVGTQTSYAPVTISYPAGVDGEVAIGVKNNFTHTALTGKYVGLEWNISSSINAAANVTFNWNASDESEGFARSSLAIARHNGTTWEVKTSGAAAAGSGPFSASISGVTQFSPWAIFDSQGALPVTLSSFTAEAEQNTAKLYWQTTAETNSDRFEIQHSENAKNWLAVGMINSAGESKLLKFYSYTHNTPSAGKNYYRLKMIDKDGSFTYSRIRSVQLSDGYVISAFVFPNPASDRLFFNTNLVSKLNSVRIYDSSGKQVLSTNRIDGSGINVKHLPDGVYNARITFRNGSAQTAKLVLTR